MKKFIEKETLVRHPVINLKSTGNNIKMLREKKGLSVKSLSEFMEFESVQAVYNWQKGRSLPSLENLMVLSELFDEAIEGILIYEWNF